jgi:hypothetical protein
LIAWSTLKTMPEGEPVTVRVADSVVTKVVCPVAWRFDDLHTGRPMKLMQSVRVADDEVYGAAPRARCSLLEEHLNVSEVYTSEVWRIAFRECQPETELRYVEIDGGADIRNRQDRVALLALDVDRRRIPQRIAHVHTSVRKLP